MEGDLLEVTMDEIQQLWQLLQLDTEYLSVFDTSPAKTGRTSAACKQEVGSGYCIVNILYHTLIQSYTLDMCHALFLNHTEVLLHLHVCAYIHIHNTY